MKLNYREKVFLAIFLSVIILVAGFFALIKPKGKEIDANKKRLETLQVQEKEIKAKINQIDILKDTITEKRDETNKIVKNFVDIELIDTPVKLDRYMEDIANKCQLRVTELAFGNTSQSPIEYYYNKNDDIASALRQSADLSGALQEKYDENNAESIQLSQRNVESILQTQYSIKCYGSLKNIYKYMEEIAKFNDAIIIDSFTYEFRGDDDEEGNSDANNDANTDENGAAPNNEDDGKKYIILDDEDNYLDEIFDAEIVISLYSVYEMSDPLAEKAE